MATTSLRSYSSGSVCPVAPAHDKLHPRAGQAGCCHATCHACHQLPPCPQSSGQLTTAVPAGGGRHGKGWLQRRRGVESCRTACLHEGEQTSAAGPLIHMSCHREMNFTHSLPALARTTLSSARS